MGHVLRNIVDEESGYISDEELDELYSDPDFEDYFDSDVYEFCGNYILTTDIVEREYRVEDMCCGIVVKDIKLSTGKDVYFAFDYGH